MQYLKLVFLASLGGASAAHADPIPPNLIGTWKLVSNTIEEIPSGTKTDLFGANPLGYITYGADGRMMIFQVRSDRIKPAASVPTEQEKRTLYDGMLGYAGTFSVEGNKLTHHVDISWNQTWSGTDQVRFFKFNGDLVELSTAPSPDPVHGKMSVRHLLWQKIH